MYILYFETHIFYLFKLWFIIKCIVLKSANMLLTHLNKIKFDVEYDLI